jgi:chaperonin GroES
MEPVEMRIVPLGDKVVVKRLDAEEVTAGGIVLPDSARDKPQEGRVLSVGDGQLLADGSRAPHQVSEGDRVLFTSYAGTEVVVEDQELLIMGEGDILAVLD